MNALATTTTALSTLVSMTGIWVLLSWFYRDYRVDLFRHRLFLLRAELFDHARKGEIAFDHPAYQELRTTLNGFLRFAERIGMVSAFFMTRAMRDDPARMLEVARWRALDEAVKTLDPPLRAELLAIRSRMHFEVFKQLLLSSPLLMLTIIPVLMVALTQFAARRLLWRLFNPLYRWLESSFERLADPLDAVAFKIGAQQTT